jgi:hypothetical protein
MEHKPNSNHHSLLVLDTDHISSSGWDLSELTGFLDLKDEVPKSNHKKGEHTVAAPQITGQLLGTVSSSTPNHSKVSSRLFNSKTSRTSIISAHAEKASPTNDEHFRDRFAHFVPSAQLSLDQHEVPSHPEEKPPLRLVQGNTQYSDLKAPIARSPTDVSSEVDPTCSTSDTCVQEEFGADEYEEDLGSWTESSVLTGKDSRNDIHTMSEGQIEAARSSDSNDESTVVLERQEWETIRLIPDFKFQELLQSRISHSGDKIATEDCHVVTRFNGGYNHIVCMHAIKSTDVEQYVIRVPAIGTVARWQEGDAHNMRCEMDLLEHLSYNTTVPAPSVIAFDDTLDNCIGAPYCLMERVHGKPAHHLWFEHPKDRDHITANKVTAETEAKRCNFLRSLAHAMAGLQIMEFDSIGAPKMCDFSTDEDSGITTSYRWKNPYEMTPEHLTSKGQIYKYGPFESSLRYMTSKLDEAWPSTPYPDAEDDPEWQNKIYGIRKILDIIYAHPTIAFSKKDPTDVAEKETFVLRHPDLDMQNILVDDSGNVVGILDWEGCLAVPRCVGYASVPDFLRRDWLKGYSPQERPHMTTWQLDHYRKVYSDAMLETGAPDAKYAAKSAMYRAIVDAVSQGSPMDLIHKICAHIPGLRLADIEELEELVGKGWPQAEEYLKAEIGKLLDLEDVPATRTGDSTEPDTPMTRTDVFSYEENGGLQEVKVEEEEEMGGAE